MYSSITTIYNYLRHSNMNMGTNLTRTRCHYAFWLWKINWSYLMRFCLVGNVFNFVFARNICHCQNEQLFSHKLIYERTHAYIKSFGWYSIQHSLLNALYSTTFIAFENVQHYLQEFDLGIIVHETIYGMEIVTVVIQQQQHSAQPNSMLKFINSWLSLLHRNFVLIFVKWNFIHYLSFLFAF